MNALTSSSPKTLRLYCLLFKKLEVAELNPTLPNVCPVVFQIKVGTDETADTGLKLNFLRRCWQILIMASPGQTVGALGWRKWLSARLLTESLAVRTHPGAPWKKGLGIYF